VKTHTVHFHSPFYEVMKTLYRLPGISQERRLTEYGTPSLRLEVWIRSNVDFALAAVYLTEFNGTVGIFSSNSTGTGTVLNQYP
jgi:hypothetical protein